MFRLLLLSLLHRSSPNESWHIHRVPCMLDIGLFEYQDLQILRHGMSHHVPK